MAKDLKLNIKNAQIAQALKKFKKTSTLTKKEKAKPAAQTTSSTKRKARIVKEEKPHDEKKPKARVVKDEKPIAEKKPKAKLAKEEDSTVTKAEVKKDTKQEPEKEIKEKPKVTIAKETHKETIKENKPSIAEAKETKAKEKEPFKTSKKSFEKPLEEKSHKQKKAKFEEEDSKKKFRSHKDFKAAKKPTTFKTFDSQARLGLRSFDDERWRKKRYFKQKKHKAQIEVIRPKSLSIKMPITIKDLAASMKLKASELIQKLFLQGITLTINDYLDDETTIQLLGHEFDCEISIDTKEEKRLAITEHTIKEEISNTDKDKLEARPAVIAFMGHVDHGKTSLIDAIRLSNLASVEAGKITQHIGAFTAKTKFGSITILDTPGHEAFSEMRTRGANVTDIAVIVIAGDEGIRDQTVEAIEQAKEANVPIVIALNKCDKAGFDPEKIYRQLSDLSLLPEAWGGTTITVNCSAITNEGINSLLEMLSLQAEILELKANPNTRARGTILESEMHKGLGASATILVQNGTLKVSDAIVFSDKYGRIKTLHDQFDNNMQKAAPSIPVRITGLSDLAEAGCEFVVVENEKIAKELADARSENIKQLNLQKAKSINLENLAKKEIKILPIIIRADVQGSLEALKSSLLKIKTDKAQLNFVSTEVGEVSESDVRLAAASKAVILAFHTKIEPHAEPLLKEHKILVKQHNIIYHAIDDVKALMQSLLDKLEDHVDTGKAKVIALFKSSQIGLIAGCLALDGIIKRSSFIRVIRDDQEITKAKISSLKKVADDVKEVSKGQECGIVLEGFSDLKKDDILEAYDINYIEQEL